MADQVPEPTYSTMLPATFVGNAQIIDGVLDVGGVKVRLAVNWPDVGVWVRRSSADLRVIQVVVDLSDGASQALLDAQNEEAARYPLGPKEYWRSELVGKATYGDHPMTEQDFEQEWTESEEPEAAPHWSDEGGL